ncbi:neurogenic locus notch homolog protein 1-like [Dreissena polymorpha]|uniref:neurogenic locus notch homolog protein 1-like n=1 Tax=Dreissena polymorpha TaxID=45954 RepID=UPI0022648DFF|nr:neurogenic locus notch homolog protein 1-like [Dreissena polymorpha]
MPDLETLTLQYNPLICDCQLRWLIETVQDSQSKLKVRDAVCEVPAHLRGRNLVNVTQADLNCSTQANDFNECAPDPCKNGATCTNHRYAYSCTCVTGWKGNNCDQDINECDPNPCKNGATCKNLQNAYSCVCSPGWQGNNCDQDINECDPAPCKNDATCNNLQNAYSCVCSPGWQGNNCDRGASTSQAPESKSTPSSTTESSTFVYIGIGLGVLVSVVIVAVIIAKKRRSRNIPSYPMTDPHHMTQCVPSQGGDYQPLAARGQIGSEYDRIADRGVLPREYDDIEITETSLQSDVPQHRATLAARTMGGDYQPLAARGQMKSEYDRIADRDELPKEYDDVAITEMSIQSDVPQYRAPLAARTMVTKTKD